MRATPTIVAMAVLFGAGSCLARDAIERAATLPDTTPWNLESLSEAPKFSWHDASAKVRTLFYRGESFRGRATRVFACYATPGSVRGDPSLDRDLPGVVLVHGGGGSAFPEWTELWARRGYAAIAMDLGGRGPGRSRHDDAGPGQSDQEKFFMIDEPVTDQWTFHAVANVIRAHSLLRSFPEVDRERTALTGISWGGYLTCIVAGLDSRFKAAVPVYGCGFLHEGSVWDRNFVKFSSQQEAKWVQLWDPSRYIGSASMPVFFVNGTNDFAYWLDSYAKTYDSVRGERNLRITVRMPHGHQAGWAPQEIGLFVDEHLRGGQPLPKVERPVLDGQRAAASVAPPHAVRSAQIHYTTDIGHVRDRQWESAPATIDGTRLTADAPPPETTLWFFTATDARGAVVSSELAFGRPTHSAVTPRPRRGGWLKRHESFNQRVKAGSVDLIFVGDSITQGWEGAGREIWSDRYSERNAVNLGISGDRTQHVLWRLDHGNIDGITPKVAVLMLGTNNCRPKRNTPAETVDGLVEVVRKLREKLPNTRILLLGIFPRNEHFSESRGQVLQVNQTIRKLDDGDWIHFLDIGHHFLEPDGWISREIMPDFLHLTAKGYSIWASSIETKLAELLGEAS